MQLPSEGSEEGQNLQPSKPPQEETVVSDAKRKHYESNRRWKKANPEKAKLHARNWYYKHRAKVLLANKSPERAERKRAYSFDYMRSPDVKVRRREYYANNAEKLRADQRARSKTPEGRAYAKAYQAKRRRENPDAHFMNWMRGSVNRILRDGKATKKGRTCEYIGCTPTELRAHLESQFTEGMKWEVGRPWDVDHIVPVPAFNLADDEEAKVCCNYKNLRPMWRLPNKYKAASIPNPLPDWIPAHIAARIEERRKTWNPYNEYPPRTK